MYCSVVQLPTPKLGKDNRGLDEIACPPVVFVVASLAKLQIK